MNWRKLRQLSFFLAVALVLTTFVGCSAKNEETDSTKSTSTDSASQSATASKGEEKTIHITAWSDQEMGGLKAEFAAIKEKYNINTEIEDIPAGTEGENLIKTRVATNDMPDIIMFNSSAVKSTLNPEQNFIDITNEPFAEKIVDSYKQTLTINGKVYGIPAGTGSVGGWMYNKKVYKQLGLSIPKTWSELIANCEKIKAAGKTAVIGSFKDDWTAQMIELSDFYNVIAEDPDFGEKFVTHKATFSNTPIALRSFEKLRQIYDLKLVNEDLISTSYDDAQKMLTDGTGVHYVMGTWAASDMLKKYPDGINDIGIFPQPGDSADSNGFTAWMPPAFYLTKSCKDVEAAKTWMSFLVSDEGMKLFTSNQGIYGPIFVKDVQMPSNLLPLVQDAVTAVNEGRSYMSLEFVAPKTPNIQRICVEVGSGIKTAAEGAAAADKDMAQQAKQLKMAGW